MVVSMLSGMSALLAQAPTTQEVADKLTLDSQILSEQFYYFTVCIMWLIHVGFMSYEAGAGRRKNVMATAMKNILTIAVVTPTFYYFGWWIYGCFSTGIIPFSPGDFLEQRGRGAARHLVLRGSDGELLLDHVSVGGQLRART